MKKIQLKKYLSDNLNIPDDLIAYVMEYLQEWHDNQSIVYSVNIWCCNYDDMKKKLMKQYGHISDWNTTYVTNMSNLFAWKVNFNDNINNWDVSNVTNMQNMFYKAKMYNQPLDKWNVGKLVNMKQMFFCANNFNQNINNWDVRNVTNMNDVFAVTSQYSHPLDNWAEINPNYSDCILFDNCTNNNSSTEHSRNCNSIKMRRYIYRYKTLII